LICYIIVFNDEVRRGCTCIFDTTVVVSLEYYFYDILLYNYCFPDWKKDYMMVINDNIDLVIDLIL
jgi:hypothetical protein